MSSSPRNERGKGFSTLGKSNAGWQQDPLNQSTEFLRKACLNVPEASMDHTNTGYAMHNLISDSRQLNDLFSPFTLMPAMGRQSIPLGIHPFNEDQYPAPSNDIEPTLVTAQGPVLYNSAFTGSQRLRSKA